ncbi:MAG TPA: hypothetical protein VF227_11145 [Actinomycetes bacterium]
MSNGSLKRWVRALGAVTLVAAMAPLTAGAANASQQGEDHKVTICHRTNSANNPYVVITIDKAAVFKKGHDTHDEGGVYQPGDKENGVRWGDIIPSFTYYASPKDSAQQTYPGLNYEAGRDILENGCEVPGEGEMPEPAGSLSGGCPDEGDVYAVSGTLDHDGSSEVEFRLFLSGGLAPIAVSGSSFDDVPVDAPAGTTVQLQYRIGTGQWTNVDGEVVTVEDCTDSTPAPGTGSFTTECTTTGALVDVGDLSEGSATGGTFRLLVNGSPQTVTSGQDDIVVPGGATLVLEYVPAIGASKVLQSATAPAACPDITPGAPTGALSTVCTATGALVDIGTLSEGSRTGGSFQLIVNGTAQGVTSGQQDIALPGAASLVLKYLPSSGPAVTLDTETAPAACPPATTVTTPTTVVPPTPVVVPPAPAAPEVAVEGTKAGAGQPAAAPVEAGVAPSTEVLGSTSGGGMLAATGATVSTGWLVAIGGLLLLAGAALVAWPATRSRRR